MKKKILLILLILIVLGNTFAEDLLKIDYLPSAGMAAVGGAHAAQVDGVSTIFMNPAGFQSEEGELSITELTLAMHGPVFDIANLTIAAIKGADITTLMSENADLLTSLYAGLDIVGPISFSYVGKGMGFGMINSTDATFKSFNGGLGITAKLGEQILLMGGYAFRIPISEKMKSYLDIGLMIKSSIRGEIEITETMFSFLSSFGNIDLLNSPFVFSIGIGADVGLRFSLSDYFAIGLVAEDAITALFSRSYTSFNNFLDAAETPVDDTEILPFRLNGGFLISPPLGGLGLIISDINIYIDYVDILDFLISPETSRNPLLNISLGFDISLLEIFSLKVGFYEGLFSAGLGLDLHFVRFQAAMFGSERGVEPGQNPVYNVIVGFEFRG